jgi:hypothetical protein
LERRSDEDLLNQELREELFAFAEQGVFSAFGMAPICASMQSYHPTSAVSPLAKRGSPYAW